MATLDVNEPGTSAPILAMPETMGTALAHFPGAHRAGSHPLTSTVNWWPLVVALSDAKTGGRCFPPSAFFSTWQGRRLALAGDPIARFDTDSPCTPSQKVAAEFASGAFINIYGGVHALPDGLDAAGASDNRFVLRRKSHDDSLLA